MIIHDYRCDQCGHIERDYWSASAPTCIECISAGRDPSVMQVTFELWERGLTWTDDELTDAKGFRKAFCATEDALCLSELGMAPTAGIQKFTPDLVQEYREKLVRDGDSPRLRQEILDKRKELVKARSDEGDSSW